MQALEVWLRCRRNIYNTSLCINLISRKKSHSVNMCCQLPAVSAGLLILLTLLQVNKSVMVCNGKELGSTVVVFPTHTSFPIE